MKGHIDMQKTTWEQQTEADTTDDRQASHTEEVKIEPSIEESKQKTIFA